MTFLRNVATVLLVLATILLGALFALQNTAPVPLDLLVYTFAPRSVALWVLAALAVGGVLGMLLSSILMLRLRTALAAARRQLAGARADVHKLRGPGDAGPGAP
ncbi:MAG: LapA family protein [Halioglobus sp.]|nr:LapA family protein [Halioglobus sp.]